MNASREIEAKKSNEFSPYGNSETISVQGTKLYFEANQGTGGKFISSTPTLGEFTTIINGVQSTNSINSTAEMAKTNMAMGILYTGTAMHTEALANLPRPQNGGGSSEKEPAYNDVNLGTVTSLGIYDQDNFKDSSVVLSTGTHRFYLNYDQKGNLLADFHTGQYEEGAKWKFNPAEKLDTPGDGARVNRDSSDIVYLRGKAYFAAPASESYMENYTGKSNVNWNQQTGEAIFGSGGAPVCGDFSVMTIENNKPIEHTDRGVNVKADLDLLETVTRVGKSVKDSEADWDLSSAQGKYTETFGGSTRGGSIVDIGPTFYSDGSVKPTLVAEGEVFVPKSGGGEKNGGAQITDSVTSKLHYDGTAGDTTLAHGMTGLILQPKESEENGEKRSTYFDTEGKFTTGGIDVGSIAANKELTDWSGLPQPKPQPKVDLNKLNEDFYRRYQEQMKKAWEDAVRRGNEQQDKIEQELREKGINPPGTTLTVTFGDNPGVVEISPKPQQVGATEAEKAAMQEIQKAAQGMSKEGELTRPIELNGPSSVKPKESSSLLGTVGDVLAYITPGSPASAATGRGDKK